MDEHANESFEACNNIVCPFPDCKRKILNTGRYVRKTRSAKENLKNNKVNLSSSGSPMEEVAGKVIHIACLCKL